MGLRSRASRKHRRRQRERARKRRGEGLARAKLHCLECRAELVSDELTELDIWNCPACQRMFLRAGPAWITELDAITSPEHEFAVVEFLRKAA